MAQLRLLDLLDSAEARGPESVPFYQSLRLDPARMGPARLTRLMLDEPERRIVSVAGQWFALTWFRDSDGLLLTSLAALALAVPCESAVDDPDLKSPVAAEPHPRYLARTPSEYITRFALAPYVQ